MTEASAFAAVTGTIIAAATDVRTGYIPNVVTRTTAAAGVLLALPSEIATAAGGACAVGGVLFALHLVTRGRGLGLGDVKLGAAIGACLGPWPGIAALGAAFIAGGVYAVIVLASKHRSRHDAIAFGPFLALGTLAAASLPASAGNAQRALVALSGPGVAQ